jgi:uncharacterized protein YqjF (DUF2071 family)
LPGPGAFVEMNVRTYVLLDGRPGVWFFSLDAASRVAVRAARRWFHLPYFDAEMSCESRGDDVVYRSRRTHRDAPSATFVGRYGPTGPPFRAATGSLDAWLTERYCLYEAKPTGLILRGDIHHPPWPLQPARAEIECDSVAAAAGLKISDARPRLLFARRLDVVGWAPHV